uniref:Uncharacterized protein n=1 Tax=Anguilla anguilla TaxID=7936 RepID=A0A0E9S4I0_ANGAN
MAHNVLLLLKPQTSTEHSSTAATLNGLSHWNGNKSSLPVDYRVTSFQTINPQFASFMVVETVSTRMTLQMVITV